MGSGAVAVEVAKASWMAFCEGRPGLLGMDDVAALWTLAGVFTGVLSPTGGAAKLAVEVKDDGAEGGILRAGGTLRGGGAFAVKFGTLTYGMAPAMDVAVGWGVRLLLLFIWLLRSALRLAVGAVAMRRWLAFFGRGVWVGRGVIETCTGVCITSE